MELVRHVSRELVTGDHAVLHMEGRSGRITVEARNLDRIQIEAEIHVWSVSSDDADEAARAVEAGIEQDGRDRVIVRAPTLPETAGGWSLLKLGQRGSRIDYRVRVPLSSSVRVLSRSGRVDVSGVQGRVHAEVMSGRCRVSDSRGETTVVARSGTAEVERLDGSLTLESRSGRVHVAEVTGDVAIESRSGTIDVTRVGGDVRINGKSGSINVDAPGAGVRVRSRCGPVRYRGAVRGDVDIEVNAGPIILVVDTAQPFFIDAEARVGVVSSDLPPRRAGEAPPTGGPKVRLRTHTGPIQIKRAD